MNAVLKPLHLSPVSTVLPSTDSEGLQLRTGSWINWILKGLIRMRYIFTDKWNSFWHFVFGMLAVPIPVIIFFFTIYQVRQGTPSEVIDMLEFIIGYNVIIMLKYIFKTVLPRAT